MANWFEVAVTYDKMMENGTVRKTTEKFLVDALSFTEAEARITEERKPYISGEFTVKACKRTKIAEIFNLGEGYYYLAAVAFVAIDEKTAVEKRTVTQMLVGASCFGEAYDNVKDGMKGTMTDWELQALSLTPILDVYNANAAE